MDQKGKETLCKFYFQMIRVVEEDCAALSAEIIGFLHISRTRAYSLCDLRLLPADANKCGSHTVQRRADLRPARTHTA